MDDDPNKYPVTIGDMARGAFCLETDATVAEVKAAALESLGLSRDQFLAQIARPANAWKAGLETLHDISQLKQMNEVHLARIRLMRFAASHTLEELLVEALDEVERLTGSRIGFYHFFDEDSSFVTLKAWSTRTTETFCKREREGGHYGVEQAGVWVDCLRDGLPSIHNDYATLPHRRGLPAGHAPVVREMVVPVYRNGRIVAVLGTGNKPADYVAADLRTVSLFADLTWDIAEQMLMQRELLASREELRLANELLEQRVSERTADLRVAIREQESFSYSVSHDLRAPLRHINSYGSLLMEEFGEEIPAGAREYLSRMTAASSRMGSLIDHLLELSRVARVELKPVPVDLSQVAADVLGMLRETEPSRRVDAAIEPGVVVQGDQHLLSQLMVNLLENAWKYTSRTETPRIEFGRGVLDGEPVCYVRDNGAGFDMSYRSNLFKPFERLHGAEFEGEGIGLATAHRIIERHGGRIWAEGAEGKGATFSFTLERAS